MAEAENTAHPYWRRHDGQWPNWQARVRPEEADALDRLCRQRGWSRRGLLQSILSPATHRSIDPTVSALSFAIPERFAVMAVAALESDLSSLRRQQTRWHEASPVLAVDVRRAAAEVEEALRFYTGVVRDYDALHRAKGGEEAEGGSPDPIAEDAPPIPRKRAAAGRA